MSQSRTDPEGNPRTIQVGFLQKPTQKVFIVWHSQEEYDRLWAGVAEETVWLLESDDRRKNDPES